MVESKTVEKDSKSNTGVLDLANVAEIEAFMSKVFHQYHHQDKPQDQEAYAHPQPTVELQSIGDADEADDVDVLLARASKAIEILATRCEIMEHDLAESAERAAEHEQVANRWKKLTLDLRSQAMTEQVALEALRVRAEAAEARVAFLEATADNAHERVAAAHARSTKLHNQVVAAFGMKSSIHSVLQAVTLQQAAE